MLLLLTVLFAFVHQVDCDAPGAGSNIIGGWQNIAAGGGFQTCGARQNSYGYCWGVTWPSTFPIQSGRLLFLFLFTPERGFQQG